MSPTAKKMTGQPVAQKRQVDVLPEMIAILAEGDALLRIAKLLHAKGWTAIEFWQVFIKDQGGSSYVENQVYNFLRDYDRGSEPANAHNGDIDTLKWALKKAKKK